MPYRNPVRPQLQSLYLNNCRELARPYYSMGLHFLEFGSPSLDSISLAAYRLVGPFFDYVITFEPE